MRRTTESFHCDVLCFSRKIFLGISILALTVGLTARNGYGDETENLVKNPSFEQQADGKSMPADWSGDAKIFAQDTTEHHEGKASLRYQNTDAQRYVLCNQRVPVKPGWMVHLSAWIKTQDVVGEDAGASLCLEWQDQSGKWMGGTYPHGIKGTQDWTLVEMDARVPENAGVVTLSCYLRKHMTGTAWFDDIVLKRKKPDLLNVQVLTPNYRGRITSEGPKEIRVQARLFLNDYDLLPRNVRLAMVLRDAAKKELFAQKDLAIPEPTDAKKPQTSYAQAELVQPIGDLPQSTYDLEVQAVKPDGTVLGASHHLLERVADDFKPHCSIDSHRRLLIDGQPFFPIGMYWHAINEKDIQTFSDSKFNCLMPYGSPNKEQMDIAWKHHLRVLYSVKDCFVGSHGCPKSVHNDAEEEEWVRSHFKTYRDHPALLGWYLNDELPPTYLPRLNAHQRWAVEEDPNHPTWVVLCHPSSISDYRNSFDAIGTDPYPIGRKSVSDVAKWTIETLKQVDRNRAMWQVPQVFNWANYEKTKEKYGEYRTPSLEEIRCMTWQCIAEGATGIIFYSWFDLKRNPDAPFENFWPGIKEIAAEIDRFAPILLSINPTPKVVATSPNISESPAWLHFTVRSSQGKVYVFAVNDGDGEGPVKFLFDSPIGQIREISSNRTLPAAGNGFEFDFKKLQVSLFEIAPSP